MSPHDHDGTGPKLTQEALAQVVRKTPERELTDEIKKRLGRSLDQIRLDINRDLIRHIHEPPPDPPPGVAYWLKQEKPPMTDLADNVGCTDADLELISDFLGCGAILEQTRTGAYTMKVDVDTMVKAIRANCLLIPPDQRSSPNVIRGSMVRTGRVKEFLDLACSPDAPS